MLGVRNAEVRIEDKLMQEAIAEASEQLKELTKEEAQRARP